jgi:hypothetical protein
MLAILLPILGGTFRVPESPPDLREAPVLYFFFTPEASGAAAAARRMANFTKTSGKRVRVRPVVLIDRFGGLGNLDKSSPFYQTLLELQADGPLDIPLYDPEGAGLAEAWGIRSVPAFVLVAGGRAHVGLGSGAGLAGMLECDP